MMYQKEVQNSLIYCRIVCISSDLVVIYNYICYYYLYRKREKESQRNLNKRTSLTDLKEIDDVEETVDGTQRSKSVITVCTPYTLTLNGGYIIIPWYQCPSESYLMCRVE